MSLVLDIDGVLVRNPRLMKHVNDNCVSYVRSKLPECKDPNETNRTLYLSHGHTAKGLQARYNVDTRDFNTKVYDKELLDHLAEVLSTKEFQDEAAELHSLTAQGWKLKLFTNAPWIWAKKVALAIGDDVNIRCPGNPMDSPLKPNPEAYLFQASEPKILVDDSLKNLGTVRFLDDWRCLHFAEDKDHSVWCPQVSSMRELCLFVRSIHK
jgi:hypothetical protein